MPPFLSCSSLGSNSDSLPHYQDHLVCLSAYMIPPGTVPRMHIRAGEGGALSTAVRISCSSFRPPRTRAALQQNPYHNLVCYPSPCRLQESIFVSQCS